MVDLQRTAYKSVSNREEVATKVAENVWKSMTEGMK